MSSSTIPECSEKKDHEQPVSEFFAEHYLAKKGEGKKKTNLPQHDIDEVRSLFSKEKVEELAKLIKERNAKALKMAAKCDPECSGIMLHGPRLMFDNDYEDIPVTPTNWPYLVTDRRFPTHWDCNLRFSERQGVLSTIMAGNPSAAIDGSIGVIEEQLKALTARTGMPVTQKNGQRHIGPPRDYDGPEPPKGSEVFIGKLPRDVFEPEIYCIFETVGRIYEIRMMMDFSGTNRGYCFVKYFTPEEASRAVEELNNKEIKKGCYIGVLISVDNCRLFVGSIPRNKTEPEILEEMKKVTDDVRRVICYPSAEDKTKNRGFAFVEYESHRAAAMARRKLLPKRVEIFGQTLQVDWAEPLPDVKASIMEKVTVLYVRNLSLSTSEEQLTKLFNEFSNNGVEKVKKMTDYAFVHFSTRDQADAAKNSLDRTEIDGCLIDIEWSKPADKDTQKHKRANGTYRNNFQRQPGFPRRAYFNGFQGFGPSGPTRYSTMSMPIPAHAHDNTPIAPGLPLYEYDQVEALEYALANQRFFPPRLIQSRENNRGRPAGGVQNFHVPEGAMQHQARRAYPFTGSAVGGFAPEQYLHGMQAGYYSYPVFPSQELHHQQFSQEISHGNF